MLLLQRGEWEAVGAGNGSESAADLAFCSLLAKVHNGDAAKIDADFRKSGLMREKWDVRHGPDTHGNMTIAKALSGFKAKSDGSDWREGCKSKSQLSTTPPKFLIRGLIPESCLTFITGPSYHCKTWFAVQSAEAVSTQSKLWCFDGPGEATPVIYHVPEMNEALIRARMEQVGVHDSEMFLVRPMESGVWPLDDPRRLKSSEGRLVFLDTQGFFNPADDAADYKQSLTYVLPRWGKTPITDLQPPRTVELWLESLPLASKTRGHIKGLLGRLVNYAMWAGMIPTRTNQISLVTVRGSSKRKRKPHNLTVKEFHEMLQHQ